MEVPGAKFREGDEVRVKATNEIGGVEQSGTIDGTIVYWVYLPRLDCVIYPDESELEAL